MDRADGFRMAWVAGLQSQDSGSEGMDRSEGTETVGN